MTREQAAILQMQAIDQDKFQVGLSVKQIINILHDYIPRRCIYEAENKLFDAFFINGVELTTNTMRKEYEQRKQLELDSLMLKVNHGVQP